MFTCKVSKRKEPDFTPFVLNMKLTTRKTAKNLFEMLEPITVDDMYNKEQKRIAQDICDMLSDNVDDILRPCSGDE